MPGLVFGKYEKIRRLAEGGMGEVWLARQVASVKGFDRLVVLKALKLDQAEELGVVEQFLDEARVAATLNHPGIVALYEVGEWGGTYYIAMEYIAGDDLSRLWYAAAKRGVGLPFQVSVRIVHDAAIALDHAHHAVDVQRRPLNIVHRDVSPQNVMVRADGVTKLVDFGIAKAANRVSITKTGTVKGKLQYMSPEQVRGEDVDGRSDQFSLGIVLWEMCTGKRLFKGDTELQTLNKILQLPIPTPSASVSGFPSELERVILRMLERDRQRRYPRCADVARDLRAYLDRAAQSGGEIPVADFVEDILGDELRARTADLTPEPSDEGAARHADDDEQAARTEQRPVRLPTQSNAAGSAEGDFLDLPTTIPADEDEDEHGPVTLSVPVLDDDEVFARPRRARGRLMLAGVGVGLLLGVGAFLLLSSEDTRERLRMVLAAVGQEPAPLATSGDVRTAKSAADAPAAPTTSSDAARDAAAILVSSDDASDESGDERAAESDESDESDFVLAGSRALEAGKSKEAASLFRKAIQADKRRADAWVGIGWAYVDLGKGEAAVRSFRRALVLPNAPPEAQFGLAEAYRFSGQRAQAVRAYERYLKQSPAGPDAEVAKNALASLQD